MGFTPEATHYKLTFEDPAYAGLEVVAESVSTGEFMELTELAATAAPALQDTSDMDPAAAAEAKKSVTMLLHAFAGALVSWNLEDRRGEPVPLTYEGLLMQKLDFNMVLVMAWIGAIADVSPNLQPGSSSSGTSGMEESLQLGSSSKSRQS